MNEQSSRCPKCDREMEQGFILDNAAKGIQVASRWAAGVPRKSFWSVQKAVPKDATPHTFTQQPAPDFDPRLTLEWPGTPEESRQRINAGQADETTINKPRPCK